MKREISLQSWIRYYWVGMLMLLAVIYAFTSSWMLRMLTQRAEETIRKSVRIVQEDIEDALEISDSFIYESLYNGTERTVTQLYYSLGSETNPIRLLEAQHTVLASLGSIVSWSDMIDFVLVYTDRADGMAWLETGTEGNYQARRELKELLGTMITGNPKDFLRRYMVCMCPQGNYMLRVLKIEKSYLIACVSEKKILRMLSGAQYKETGIAFVAKEDGRVIAASGTVAGVLSPQQEGTYISVDGKQYLQTGYVSEQTGYYFGMLTDKQSILEDMKVFRLIFFLVFLILMILVPVVSALLHVYVGMPIRSIADSMARIATGDLDVTVAEQSGISELGQLVRSFNHMVGRIKQLKIEKYESRLEMQKATMQYLQLQIKPHFYANMFNIIYSLAQCRDYDTIQRISQSVVDYSRYMFRDAAELVELKRELEHVRAYMEIQEIRYMKQIICEIEAGEETFGALIPPFVIQSFVENSVKYAFSLRESNRILIRVQVDDAKEYLRIRIRDNGVGYSDELLGSDWKHTGESEHIGLTNVYRRLCLIYGDRSDIRLENESGAVTTIKLPYIAVDDGANEDV